MRRVLGSRARLDIDLGFRVVGDAVHILRVLHDAMDLPEHLKDT